MSNLDREHHHGAEHSSTAETCQSPELHSSVNLLPSLRAVVVAAFVVLVLFLLQVFATVTTGQISWPRLIALNTMVLFAVVQFAILKKCALG